MDIPSDIRAFEARLKAAGIPVADFCRQAKVHRATWQRWKSGEVVPRLDTWSNVLKALPDEADQEARQ